MVSWKPEKWCFYPFLYQIKHAKGCWNPCVQCEVVLVGQEFLYLICPFMAAQSFIKEIVQCRISRRLIGQGRRFMKSGKFYFNRLGWWNGLPLALGEQADQIDVLWRLPFNSCSVNLYTFLSEEIFFVFALKGGNVLTF